MSRKETLRGMILTSGTIYPNDSCSLTGLVRLFGSPAASKTIGDDKLVML